MSLINDALALAELGYRVFPLAPNSKQPLPGSRGCTEATTDEDQIADWWEATPSANIGLATDGLVVVDIDQAGDEDHPWLTTESDKYFDLLGGASSITPRGGFHLFHRMPEGLDIRCSAGKVAKGVDIRANGGYVVVPPSVIESGRYSWNVALELDVPAHKLPLPPQWLLNLIFNDGQTPEVKEDLPSEVNQGKRNDLLARFGGHFRQVGMTAAEIEGALLRINSSRCKPPLAVDEVRAIANSVAKYEPDQIREMIISGAADLHFDPDDKPEGDPHIFDPGPLPDRLLHVPGFVGEVVEWNLSHAFRKQPEYALAGAICLQAVLAGRKIRDKYNNRTCLFIISVGGSGSGKDQARKVNTRILETAGVGELEGEGKFGSDASIITMLEHRPAVLCQPDEFGRYLKTMTEGGRNSPWLDGIITALLEVYTSADNVYRGKAYAEASKNRVVNQPCLVIHGATVPTSLYGSLKSGDFLGGLVGRLLIFEGRSTPEKQRLPQPTIPASIIERVRWWSEFQPVAGNLSDLNPQPVVYEHTDEAERLIDELDELADAEIKAIGDPYAALWARAVQNASRLALVYAASRSTDVREIDAEAFRWASDVVVHLTRKTIHTASLWVSEGQFDERQTYVLRAIRENDGVSQTELSRKTRRLRPRERTEILTSLQMMGYIWRSEKDGKTKKTICWHAS